MPAVRPTAVAGRFYPGTEAGCRELAAQYFQEPAARRAVGAVVPHAGWVYSGATAALGWSAIAAGEPGTIIVFGAVHGPDANVASACTRGGWDTPLGPLFIDEELAHALTQHPLIKDNPGAHRREHSIEVQLPLAKYLLPDVRFIPIGVRPSLEAPEIGRFCAAAARSMGRTVAFVGSTDLTHYGPAFGFEPHGRGEAGVRWAKEVNDRRMIDRIQAGDAAGIVPEAVANHNACGPGAIAALIGAMNELGGLTYRELRHTCSAECQTVMDRDPWNSVGYEAGVFVTES